MWLLICLSYAGVVTIEKFETLEMCNYVATEIRSLGGHDNIKTKCIFVHKELHTL